MPSDRSDPDAIDPCLLAPWLTVVDTTVGEHVVLSDGWHHIRIDVERGSLATQRPVVLHYRLKGLASAEPKVLPLRRLFDLYRRQRFAVTLYPADRRIDRWLLALRVHDALVSGASHAEIGRALFSSVGFENDRQTDSLRSRVRRLVREAQRLAGGGYRSLLR